MMLNPYKLWKEQNGYTALQVAGLLGVNYSTVNKYTQGIHSPRRSDMAKIADIMGLDVDTLYRYHDEMIRNQGVQK